MNTTQEFEILGKEVVAGSNVILDVKAVCRACESEYGAITFNGRLVTTGMCNPCSEISVASFEVKEKEARYSDRILKFRSFCPEMYFSCDPRKLPLPEHYQKVMSGLRPQRGLILIGESRSGKTRSAYALLKGLYLEMEKSCFSITELQLSHELSKFGKNTAALDLIDKLCCVDYLFIDDLGKSVMTQRVVSELYYIIEERISHYKPTIVTMQISMSDFNQKMAASSGGDIADAIIARLKEHCDVIIFK